MPPPVHGRFRDGRAGVLAYLVTLAGVAVLYLLLGLAALPLREPPAVTPLVWPAAGLALFAVIQYGPSIWPGILLGATLTNLARFPAMGIGLDAIAFSGALGLAAVVHGVVGGVVVRRTGQTVLGSPRDVLRTLLVGGPLAGALGAAVAIGVMATSFPSWFTWWVGDTLGVWLTVPVLAAWKWRGHPGVRRRIRVTVTVPVLLIAALSVVVFVDMRESNAQHAEMELTRQSDFMAWALRRSVDTRLAALQSVVRFCEFSETVTEQEFEAFTRPLIAPQRGILAIGANLWADDARRGRDPSADETERAPGEIPVPTTDVKPSGFRRREKTIVVHDGDLAEGTASALIDALNSESLYREILEASHQWGPVVALRPMPLVEEAVEGRGVLVVALFDPDVKPSGAHSLARPFVSCVLLPNTLMQRALAEFGDGAIDYRLEDCTVPTEPVLLAAAGGGVGAPPVGHVGSGRQVILPIPGRQWVMTVRPKAGYALGRGPARPWIALVSGVFVTSVLGVLLLVDVSRAAALQSEVRERRHVEAALIASETRLRTIFEASTLGLIIGDHDGRILETNAYVRNMLGCEAWELTGRALGDFILSYGPSSHDPTLPLPDDGRQLPPEQEVQLEARDGRILWVILRRSRIRSEDQGDPGFLLDILEDVTVTRRLKEEILRAQKLESVGNLAGGIAHDFNNLLVAIGGNVGLARLRAEGSVATYLAEAEKALARAKGLTGQLLTFAKGGAPVKETVDLGDLIRDAAGFTLSGSSARSEVDVPEDLWPARVDPGQIVQVLGNLVLNAAQAKPDGGVVRIHACNVCISKIDALNLARGDYVLISVEDDGPGIPLHLHGRIFEPYFTTKEKGKGTGLGLATAYSIVTKHDGAITVESEPGRGATFKVFLPAAHDTPLTRVTDASRYVTRGQGRILVMDDDAVVRTLVGRLLAELGYVSHLTSDGKEAIEEYRRSYAAGRPFDAVILDLTVPGGMGGKEALRHLRTIDPAVRAIVSSGYSDDPVLADFHAHGFAAAAAKPYTLQEFAQVLAQVLNGDAIDQKEATG